MQPHDVAGVIVQRNHKKMEAQQLVKTLGQIVEELRQILVGSNDAGDVHQREMLLGGFVRVRCHREREIRPAAAKYGGGAGILPRIYWFHDIKRRGSRNCQISPLDIIFMVPRPIAALDLGDTLRNRAFRKE